MTHEQIPYDDTTRPDEKLVDLMREQIKRRVRLLNEFDLQRALYTIRPEQAKGESE